MWALFESPLGHHLCQACGPWPVRHQCKSLSYVVDMFNKFVENNVPINQQEG